jgi:hypothetical protein
MLHYIVSFVSLFIVFPWFVFRYREGSILDNLARNFIKIVFVYIIGGYLLVVLRIYEFLAIVILMISIKLFFSKESRKETAGFAIKANSYILDFAENKTSLRNDIGGLLRKAAGSVKKSLLALRDPAVLLLFVACACSLYVRIYNAFIHPAPSMSDSSVTLAWMKYIESRMLFYDGIYPMGFHIYLATLRKFSGINQLYVLSYSGAISGLMTTLGIYFFTSRVTKSKSSGVVAAVIIGILGQMVFNGWVRQAATNSQEFAYLFVMPTLYFYYKYLSEGNKDDLFTAFCGITVIGLIHTVAMVFCGIGIIVMIFVYFITSPIKRFKSVLKATLSGILCIVFSSLPLVIGMLVGVPLNESSADYLFSTTTQNYFPPIRFFDLAGFAALGLVVLYLLISIFTRKDVRIYLFILFYGVLSFLIVYYGPSMTKSLVITNRFSDMWNLFIPVIIGAAFNIITLVLRKISIRNAFQLLLAGALLTYSIYYTKLVPIIPYKVQSDAAVEQYLKISNNYRPTEWHMVSDIVGGYALAYGYAYHIQSTEFVVNFDPTQPQIRDLTSDVILPNIFIYYEKNVFVEEGELVSTLVRSQYEARLVARDALGAWLEKYKATHDDYTIFYEDKDLIIYYIKQDTTKSLFKNF